MLTADLVKYAVDNGISLNTYSTVRNECVVYLCTGVYIVTGAASGLSGSQPGKSGRTVLGFVMARMRTRMEKADTKQDRAIKTAHNEFSIKEPIQEYHQNSDFKLAKALVEYGANPFQEEYKMRSEKWVGGTGCCCSSVLCCDDSPCCGVALMLRMSGTFWQ